MALTAVVNGILIGLQSHALWRLEMRLSVSALSKFFWKLLALPMEFFGQRYAGEIGARVEANDRAATLLSRELRATWSTLSSRL